MLIGMLILSCSGFPLRETGPRGVYHRVKSGETLYAIARAYNVDLQELAEINNISHSEKIEADGVIFIPDANQIVDEIMIAVQPREPLPEPPAEAKPATDEEAVSSAKIPGKEAAVEEKRRPRPLAEAPVKAPPVPPRETERSLPQEKGSGRSEGEKTASPPVRPKEPAEKRVQIQFDKVRFIWPVKGRVVSTFGIQPNRMYFNGIRIAADEGTPVKAAAGGVVIFSAPLKDYGETIILRHEDDYATVYAGLGIRTVRGEARVKQGDRIAFVGKAVGKERSASLHFEIRKNSKARNPLFFLP